MATTRNGGTGELRPAGESVKQAVRWISSQRRDDPGVKLAPLIEQAAIRFDLSPLEAEFLVKTFLEAP